VFARIDRRRKLPVTIILRALGMTERRSWTPSFEKNTFYLSKDETALQLVAQRLRGETATFELSIGDQVIVEEAAASRRATCASSKRRGESACACRASTSTARSWRMTSSTPKRRDLAKANEVLTALSVEKLIEASITEIQTLYTNDLDRGPYISDTLRVDPTKTRL